MVRIILGKYMGKDWIGKNWNIIAVGLELVEGLALILGISSALIVSGVFSRVF
jgi:hypothetical protein